MTFERSSADTTPLMKRPLTNIAGVPLTPALVPACMSLFTAGVSLPESRQLLKLAALMPAMPAAFDLSASTASPAWSLNMASCISQNLPCSLAHSDASAALAALGCMGRGHWRKTRRTLLPYFDTTCSRVGVIREQKGHWKSENSTIVTGAPAGPLAGKPLAATSTRIGSIR